jgi:Mor family transcriptional regulator
MVKEAWRDIKDFRGYKISSWGRIKMANKFHLGLIMANQKTRSGHLKIILIGEDEERFTKQVHRLVLEAFHGEKPFEHRPFHINSVKTDNRANNLKWVHLLTPVYKPVKKKMNAKGESHNRAKLTEKQVREIKALIGSGSKLVDLAKLYRISTTAIWNIKVKKTWRHI